VDEVRLICHRSTPTSLIDAIEVTPSRAREGRLQLRFTISGDLAAVRIAAPTTPRVGDRLWEHTCCEAFLAIDGAPAYHELNFSPSGEWAGYAFRAYRERSGEAADAVVAPLIVERRADWLSLEAHIDVARLSAHHVTQPLRLALSAVIEARDGARSYWALHHPHGQPDFHHADAFALRLEAPGAG